MIVSGFGGSTAGVARRLAAAASHVAGEELAGAIRLAQSATRMLPAYREVSSSGEAERAELLGAVLQAMERSLARTRGETRSTPEADTVHLRLLWHLAGAQRPEMPCRAASGAV